MALRGEAHRAAILAVLDVFGEDARHFVFIGGCTLGLYARPEGAPLRATNDVDCISTLIPWVLQDKLLADMCSRGVLSPDPGLKCRYRRARAYDLGEGRSAMALTPPYFLTTKLIAFEDRGPDARSSKDVEDIVALLVEVMDLVAQVDAEGVRADVAALWHRALVKYSRREDDLPDLVDWHLDSREANHRDAVIAALGALVAGNPKKKAG